MNKRYIAYHTLIGYRMNNRNFFPHRLQMSVSYSAGAYVPTFSRFRITLRRRRPHEPSSRPPCRRLPTAAVQALADCRRGRRARWRKKQTKRSTSSREKGREAQRVVGFLLLDLLHILIPRFEPFLGLFNANFVFF